MTLEELLPAALQAKIEISGAMEGVGAHRRPTELTALEANAIRNLFLEIQGEGEDPSSRKGRAIEKLLTGGAEWLTAFVVRARTDPTFGEEPGVTTPPSPPPTVDAIARMATATGEYNMFNELAID